MKILVKNARLVHFQLYLNHQVHLFVKNVKVGHIQEKPLINALFAKLELILQKGLLHAKIAQLEHILKMELIHVKNALKGLSLLKKKNAKNVIKGLYLIKVQIHVHLVMLDIIQMKNKLNV